MPLESTHQNGAVSVAASPLGLLIQDISFDGWEDSIGKAKSYYVRRATWFYRTVWKPKKITDLIKLDKEILTNETLFADCGEWIDGGFDWDEPFGPRQAVESLKPKNRQPIRFDKAVKTILLCRHLAKVKAENDVNFSFEDPLIRMRIEPAVFYIQDFNLDLLEELVKEKPNVIDDLKRASGQITRQVIGDIAGGCTVTKRLAERLHKALKNMFPDRSFGSVDYKYQQYYAKGASKFEALAD